MSAINKVSVDYLSFNSGVLLSIAKYRQWKPEVLQEIIQEWCKHVSQIFYYFSCSAVCSFCRKYLPYVVCTNFHWCL